MKKNLANVLSSGRYWTRTVTKMAKQLKKENPKNPYLSHDEKTVLFLKWKNEQCIKSRDKLLSSLYPFVLQQVHEKINMNGNNNIDVADLEQEANLALLDCLGEYDPEKGTLPTFFRTRLPKFFFPAIKTYGNLIKQPDNILKCVRLENTAFDKYVQIHGHYPNIGEPFSFKYRGKTYQIVFGGSSTPNVVSGNKTLDTSDDQSFELFDLISNEEDKDDTNDEKLFFLKSAITSLSLREQEILNLTYNSNLEVAEIVCRINPISPYDYRRLYKRAKNTVIIKTKNGHEQTLVFFVYHNAPTKTKKIIKNDKIEILSHRDEINYQSSSSGKILFSIQNDDTLDKVFLNGVPLLEKDICKIFNNNTNKQTFNLNLSFKVGSIYSPQNYSILLNKIKDKLRKKIIKNYDNFH